MSAKHLIAIGIDDTQGMAPLRAAVSGATQFRDWAVNQGFEVALLAGKASTEVTIEHIKRAVKSVVEAGNCEQLIVFFSGHGIVRSPGEEIWLLTNATVDGDEAVNLFVSTQQARSSGIPHIIFISDACRVSPTTHSLTHVRGGSIFPTIDIAKPRPEIDSFYATRPGKVAYEIPLNQTTTEHRGIYTDCLLKALKGQVPSVIEQFPVPPRSNVFVVPSWTLKPYLESEVPVVAATVSIKTEQDPDAIVESHRPKYIVEIQGYTAPQGGGNQPPQRSSASLPNVQTLIESATMAVGQGVLQKLISPIFRPFVSDKPEALKSRAVLVGKILNARGRESFETRTGFTVIGAEVKNVTSIGAQCDLFEERGAPQIRVHESSHRGGSNSVVITFASGQSIVVAALPEFIGTILVHEDHVININYTPSRYTSHFEYYEAEQKQVDIRRAAVAAAATDGAFRLARDEAERFADFIRMEKSIDPTLGLYAAYAYTQCGAFDQVASVYEFMKYEDRPVLFDVALLADSLPSRFKPHGISLDNAAPWCPMLNQGWSLLQQNAGWLSSVPGLSEASRFLEPGLWTTFDKRGTEILNKVVEQWAKIKV